jgi:hypothetical protein
VRARHLRLVTRLALATCLFVLGLSVALACGSHMNKDENARLTTTVTTNGSVTTIVTGP